MSVRMTRTAQASRLGEPTVGVERSTNPAGEVPAGTEISLEARLAGD